MCCRDNTMSESNRDSKHVNKLVERPAEGSGKCCVRVSKTRERQQRQSVRMHRLHSCCLRINSTSNLSANFTCAYIIVMESGRKLLIDNTHARVRAVVCWRRYASCHSSDIHHRRSMSTRAFTGATYGID